MDYKEKVEWLGRYQASVSCQHMLEEEIEVLRSDAERVTACMSGMPGRRTYRRSAEKAGAAAGKLHGNARGDYVRHHDGAG